MLHGTIPRAERWHPVPWSWWNHARSPPRRTYRRLLCRSRWWLAWRLRTTPLEAGTEREAMTNDRTHVVVVEDDADTRDLVQVVLEDAGSTVTLARDGAAALAALWKPSFLPDLILLDLRMSLIDGRTFWRMQQGHPQWRTIPVVVLSANIEVHATAAALGMAAVLLKPCTVPELVATVQRYAR